MKTTEDEALLNFYVLISCGQKIKTAGKTRSYLIVCTEYLIQHGRGEQTG
jgi:hypothetical protein